MNEKTHSPVTRKQFLQLFIAGGSALTAATILPGKWLKPVIRMGVLPAHAQTSYPATSTPTVTTTPAGTHTPTPSPTTPGTNTPTPSPTIPGTNTPTLTTTPPGINTPAPTDPGPQPPPPWP